MQFIILIRIIFWHSLIKTGYHFVSRYWLKPDHAMQRLSHAVRPGHADWSPGSKVQSSRGALLEMPLRFFRTLLMMLPTPPEPCCRCFTPALGLLPAAGSLSCLIGNQTVQSPHRFNNPPLSFPLTTWNPSAAVPPPPKKNALLQDVKKINRLHRSVFQISSGDSLKRQTLHASFKHRSVREASFKRIKIEKMLKIAGRFVLGAAAAAAAHLLIPPPVWRHQEEVRGWRATWGRRHRRGWGNGERRGQEVRKTEQRVDFCFLNTARNYKHAEWKPGSLSDRTKWK